jgi:RecB family exonuclease
MRLSYSSISMYQNCPLSYKFAYVDRIPVAKKPALSFGSSLHATLRDFYNVPLPVPPSQSELLEMLKKNWDSSGYSSPEEEASHFDYAKQILRQFYEKNQANFQIPLALEQSFQIEVDSIKVVGVIDRVDSGSEGIEVIDYKTSKKLPPQKSVDTDLQLTLYHWAAEEMWGMSPKRLSLYFLRSNISMSTQRNRQSVDEAKQLVINTAEQIREKKFQPRENPLCPWCDYQPLCPLFEKKFRKNQPQINQLVEEFGQLKEERKNLERRLKELKVLLDKVFEKEQAERLFSENFLITRKEKKRYEYDLKSLKNVLEPSGLWEKVVTIDALKLQEVLAEASEDLKRAIEKSRQLVSHSHTLYVRKLKEDNL